MPKKSLKGKNQLAKYKKEDNEQKINRTNRRQMMCMGFYGLTYAYIYIYENINTVCILFAQLHDRQKKLFICVSVCVNVLCLA